MKILFIAILFIVSASVYIIKSSGYNPKPILVMKPSSYSSLDNLGRSLLRRFFKESELSEQIYIVCSSELCDKISLWNGFLQASVENKLEKRKVYLSSSLKEQSVFFPLAEIVSEVDNVLNKKSIIFINHNEENKFLKSEGKKPLIFYMTSFYVQRDKEPSSLICDGVEAFRRLPCLGAFYSRDFYKKNLDKNTSFAGMNRVSANKYVLYLYQ